MQDGESKFQKRMSLEDKETILRMKQVGKNNAEIGRALGYSNTAIRLYLKSLNIDTSLSVDRSRPCKVCGKIFTPKSYDGVKKNKYTNCSPECGRKSLVDSKTKYDESEINRVIHLKKMKITNSEIADITKVDLNKIKEITRDNDLYLSSEDAQKNAYNSKLLKNPNAMVEMRDERITCPTNEFNIKINAIKEQLEKEGNTYGIPYLAEKVGLIAGSVRQAFHLRGWSHLIGTGCSMAETEVFELVRSCVKDEEIQQGNRSILKGKEIDIFIPSANLGIEYCDLYWHNEHSPEPRDKKYHLNKMKQCNEQGIRLITIYEDEWKDRNSQVKNYLKSVLGSIDLKVFARKCEIRQVESKTASSFLDENHIQGSTTMKVAFGLYYNNELVGLITGNKHHRQGFDNIFVLNRLVFKDGVQVVGGSSKLIKYLCNWARDNGYIELISWSDNRWSEGNVYEKTGFRLVEELPPDYSYVTPEGTRQSKQSNQKKHLLKKGGVGKTELEMATSIGFFRIWDCGKKRWSIDL